MKSICIDIYKHDGIYFCLEVLKLVFSLKYSKYINMGDRNNSYFKYLKNPELPIHVPLDTIDKQLILMHQ